MLNVTVVDALFALAIETEDEPLVAVHLLNWYPVAAVALILYAVPAVIPVLLPDTVLLFGKAATVSFLEGIVKFAC